jgi:hypothetical protein
VSFVSFEEGKSISHKDAKRATSFLASAAGRRPPYTNHSENQPLSEPATR